MSANGRSASNAPRMNRRLGDSDAFLGAAAGISICRSGCSVHKHLCAGRIRTAKKVVCPLDLNENAMAITYGVEGSSGMDRGDLGNLAAFVAVADQRSFRAAAARFGVTPSALGHSLWRVATCDCCIGRRAVSQRPMLANACSASFGRQSRKSPVR
jgi:hypothetical protein